MIISKAEFVMSNTDPALCPAPDRPEFAFVGRSNVGKSSLINMLTDVKNLAKVSSEPGKTRLINHFDIDDRWYLVDLPGYGFAKVVRTEREKWEKFIRKYLLHRENLYCVFALIDSRHKLQALDLDFMNWMGENGIPFSMVFTKTDKLSKRQLGLNIEGYRTQMLEHWEELPPQFLTSAEKNIGKSELLDYIDGILKESRH